MKKYSLQKLKEFKKEYVASLDAYLDNNYTSDKQMALNEIDKFFLWIKENKSKK